MLTMPTVLSLPPSSVVDSAESDAILVDMAKKELSAFAGLYQRHADKVYRYLLVRVNNVHDAQDLTSQTFLAAMENIHTYREYNSFIAWLLGIARNKAADHYRRKRPEIELESAEHLQEGNMPDEIIGQRLQIEQVARKLQTTSPERAEALTLRLFAGLEVAEIAQLLGKSEASVRMLVYRGLQDLQTQLNPEGEV